VAVGVGVGLGARLGEGLGFAVVGGALEGVRFGCGVRSRGAAGGSGCGAVASTALMGSARGGS
jgi:hypothetical protein